MLFRQGISQVVFASATDESRPVLTGIDVQIEGSLLTMAAADGFRLAVYKLPVAKASGQKLRLSSLEDYERAKPVDRRR